MSVNDIYADASEPASVRHAGVTVDCHTLQEAVIEFHKRPAEQKERTTIKVLVPGGALYTASEIERLRYGPKPLS